MTDAQIHDPDAIFRYAMAGDAIFTLVSRSSGLRFTFQVSAKKVFQTDGESEEQWRARQREAFEGVRFVKVLTGPDNTHDYTYLGHVNGATRKFRTDRATKVRSTAPSVRAFAWFWDVLVRRLPKLDQLEVWHNGRCSHCGRSLTVPESVATGLGPICAEKMGVALAFLPKVSGPPSSRPRGPLSFRLETTP